VALLGVCSQVSSWGQAFKAQVGRVWFLVLLWKKKRCKNGRTKKKEKKGKTQAKIKLQRGDRRNGSQKKMPVANREIEKDVNREISGGGLGEEEEGKTSTECGRKISFGGEIV